MRRSVAAWAAVIVAVTSFGLVGAQLATAAGSSAPSTTATLDDPSAAATGQGNPSGDGHAATALASDLTAAWSANVAAYAPLVAADGRAFALSDWDLVALDAHDGSQLWDRPMESATAGLTLVGDEVVSVSRDGFVQAFSVDDGAERWARPLQGQQHYLAAPVAVGGVVYVLGDDYTAGLWALDGATGAVLWHSYGGESGALHVLDGRVIATQSNGAGLAFDAATGAKLWSEALPPGSYGSDYPIDALHDGRTWRRTASSYDPVLDATTGVPIANTPTYTDTAAPAFDGTQIFFSGTHITAADETTPTTTTWTSTAGDYLGRPLLTVSGMVAALGSGPRIDLLDEADGHVLFSAPLPGANPQSSSPGITAADGVLYVPWDSWVYAFASDTVGLPAAPAHPISTPVTPAIDVDSAVLDSWIGEGGDTQRDGRTADSVTPTLTSAWTSAIGPPSLQPIVVGGAVIIVTTDGTSSFAHGLNPSTGQLLWTSDAIPTRQPDAITEGDGVVVIGTSGGSLTGIEAATGQTLWSTPYRSDFHTVFPQADALGHFYLANEAFDITTGQLVGGPTGGLDESGTTDAVDGLTVYATESCARAVRSDALVRTWDARAFTCYGGAFTPPILIGSVLDIRDSNRPQNGVTANATTGAFLAELPSQTMPAGDGSTAFVVNSALTITAIDTRTRVAHWKTDVPNAAVRQIVVAQGRLIALLADGEMAVLDEATGDILGITQGAPLATAQTNVVTLGLAVAQGIVVEPTTTGISAFSDGSPTIGGLPHLPVPPISLTPIVAPSSATPTSAAPTISMPSSEAPTTEPPTSAVPTSTATPTTNAPTSTATPTTNAPTTPPATTSPPSSEPPTSDSSSAPTPTTAAPTTAISPTPTATATPSPSATHPPSSTTRPVTSTSPPAAPSIAAPAPVTGLTATATTDGIVVSWSRSITGQPLAYALATQPTRRLAFVTSTTARLRDLPRGQDEQVMVAAIGAGGVSPMMVVTVRSGEPWTIRPLTLNTQTHTLTATIVGSTVHATVTLQAWGSQGWHAVESLRRGRDGRWRVSLSAVRGGTVRVVVAADARHLRTASPRVALPG